MRGRFGYRCGSHAPAPELVVVVLIAAYVVSAFGLIPSPGTVARVCGTVLQERFPCEGCRCGCYSARQCWTSCCCHTPGERVAWARANRVRIPDYAAQAVLAAAAEPAQPGGECPLCDAGGDGSCGADESSGLPGLSALGCRGTQAMWVAALIGLVRPDLRGILVPMGTTWAGPRVEAWRACVRPLDVPTPPPRLA